MREGGVRVSLCSKGRKSRVDSIHLRLLIKGRIDLLVKGRIDRGGGCPNDG